MEAGTLSILGILLIGLHFYARVDLYYYDNKPNSGFKAYDEKLKAKVKNNEKLSLWESLNYYLGNAIRTIVNWSLKTGLALIVIDIILALILK